MLNKYIYIYIQLLKMLPVHRIFRYMNSILLRKSVFHFFHPCGYNCRFYGVTGRFNRAVSVTGVTVSVTGVTVSVTGVTVSVTGEPIWTDPIRDAIISTGAEKEC